MKSLVIYSLIAATFPLFCQSIQADEQPVTAKAVQIDIGSIGGKLDTAAIRTVRQVLGYNIANGTVDNFNVYRPKNSVIPIEGGLSACADAGFNVSSNRFATFINDLKTIKPRSGTFYTLTPKESCTTPDNSIVCTQDVKQCPDGSFVGRIPPSCAFKPCPPVK